MASGDILAKLWPDSYDPPASDLATLDTINTRKVLDFDLATNETAVWSEFMPTYYDGGGVTVDIYWSSTEVAGAGGDVDWDGAFERVALTLDVTTSSFAAANSTDNNLPNATANLLVKTTITFTDGADMDSVSAGELFRFSLLRDAASDTMNGDASVHLVVLTET